MITLPQIISGGTSDDYDIIVDEVAFRGEITAWRELLSRVRAGDYVGTQELLDVDKFIDYTILHIYMGNWDWPDHNWHALRRRADGEKFFSRFGMPKLEWDSTSIYPAPLNLEPWTST